MNLKYAVDRLEETCWTPDGQAELERLPDGRAYPSVAAVQRLFASQSLQLSIKQNLMFSCWRATWAPVGESVDPAHAQDGSHGTVVGACEREAAVYALSQLLQTHVGAQLALV